MNTYMGYKVNFVPYLPADKGYFYKKEFFIPESVAYKFIFMTEVNDITVKVAINHAIQKLNRFIDRLS